MRKKMKTLLFSIDVEPDYNKDKSKISYNHIRNNLLPFLDYLMLNNITATLFIPPKVLSDNEPYFKKYYNFFEFACHVHPELDEKYKSKNKIKLTNLTEDEQLKLIRKSKTIIENITKQKVISFRASSHKLNDATFRVLNKLKFKADSSFLSYVTFNEHRTKPYPLDGLNLTEFPVTTTYEFPLIIKLPVKLRNIILNKRSGITFTGYTLNKLLGYNLIDYSIKSLFKKNEVLSLYVHSYDLGVTQVLNNLKQIIYKNKKKRGYHILSIKKYLEENDSLSKNFK